MKIRILSIAGAGILLAVAAIILSSFSASFSESSYLSAAQAGGDYLVTQMYEDGSFVYEYNPETDEVPDDYNILRHAGSTYSLLELYEATNDQKYLASGEKAIAYLINQVISCPMIPAAACVEEDAEVKLGGNALTILALAKHAEVTGNKGHLSLAERLAAFIVGVQSPSGEFSVHKMTNGVADDFKSEYYPGEAMFGLAKLSEVSGDRKWLDAAHKGAHWMITVRDAAVPTDELPHDHWFLYALNELGKDRQESMYIDHAKKLTEAIAAAQHVGLNGDQKDWNGGYYDPPRSTPTATRNEGLGAAYELFTRAGEAAFATVGKETMERGIDFTLRTQDANGGFHESLDEYVIRIDYVQHNISALLAFDRILSEK
jgi:rhamnogalacturonyl hydrolase YesR